MMSLINFLEGEAAIKSAACRHNFHIYREEYTFVGGISVKKDYAISVFS